MVRGYPFSGTERECFPRNGWNNVEGRQDKYLSNDVPIVENRSLPIRPTQAMTVEAALRDYCHLPVQEFALTILQHDGSINSFTSPALELEVPRLKEDFQRAIHRSARNSRYTQQNYHRIDDLTSYTDPDTDNVEGTRRQSSSTDSSTGRQGGFPRHLKTESGDTDEEVSFGTKHRKRPRVSTWSRYAATTKDDTPVPTAVNHTRQLVIGNSVEVENFYTQRFRDLQQHACKILGKAFVKVMEPKKQTNHPYTGGAKKAPSWWPEMPDKASGRTGVRHKEPDHLLKGERVQLLVHIIRVVVDQSPAKPAHLKQVTIKKLEEVGYEAMSNWFNDKDHPDNASKKPFLREIFKIAKQEERYHNGEIDADCSMPIMHGDDRTGLIESDDEVDDGLKYEDDEYETEELVTVPQTSSTAVDGVISPLSVAPPSSSQLRAAESDGSETFAYSHMRELPVRSFPPHALPHQMDEQQTYGENGQMQSDYLSRPAGNFQHQNLGGVDHNRRSAWAPNGYSSLTPPPIFNNNWALSANGNHGGNSIGHNNLPQYATYSPTAPPSGPQATPYLPPPSTSALLPPMHQQQGFSDGLVSRGFESIPHLGNTLRTGSLGHPHQLPQQHHHSFQEYLHDNSYGHNDSDMKDDQIHAT